MKVARTVLSGGKDGDNFKVLPIATKVKQTEYSPARKLEGTNSLKQQLKLF
ncbi:hypothetical protein OB996_25985 [Bacillus cereus]|nr:hypothetical protein [Bacillus cereus]